MGFPMARNLRAAGFAHAVNNRRRTKAAALAGGGAAVAAWAADAAERARIVITMLADDQAIDDVVFGERSLLAGMKPGAIHVGMSTVEPATSRRLAVAHRAQGSEYLAAPVFGRPEVAAEAKLYVIAAGPPGPLETALPGLRALSRGVSRGGGRPG